MAASNVVHSEAALRRRQALAWISWQDMVTLNAVNESLVRTSPASGYVLVSNRSLYPLL